MFIDIALQNDIIDDGVINAVILALRSNNVLFNKHANPVVYQQLANRIYSKNMDNIDPAKKAVLYANLVGASSVFESGETLSTFEKEILHLINLIENQKKYGELFFVYAHMCQFYLLLGDFKEAKKYAEKAQKYIDCADNIFSLFRYWYARAWLCYELRDIDAGIKALDNYTKLISSSQCLSPVGKLFARDLSIKFKILMKKKEEAQKELEETIKDAKAYHNNVPSGVLGELEYTKTLLYFQSGQYELAKDQCNHALNILTKVFGGDIIDLTQAHIHIMLGEIEEEKGNYNLALEEYRRVLKFYDEKSYGRVNHFHEYGELLANLCTIYYKQKNYLESKFYFQKLVANFGLDHEIVEKLIKKLPVEYMYQISGNVEK